MKTCPQCNTVYEPGDENIYCLMDGNALVGGDGEQETVLNRKFVMPPPNDSLAAPVYCASCGSENRAHSRFCKKCSGSLNAVIEPQASEYGFHAFAAHAGAGAFSHPSPNFAPPVNPQILAETITFPPPFSGSTRQSRGFSNSNRTAIISVVAIAGLSLIGLAFVLSREGSSESNAGNNARTPVTTASPGMTSNETAALPNTFERRYGGYAGDKSLSMTLKRDNQNLTGTASTTRKTDVLKGSINPDGSFELYGYENGRGDYTGIWSGQIHGDGSVTGYWTKRDNPSVASSFSLNQR